MDKDSLKKEYEHVFVQLRERDKILKRVMIRSNRELKRLSGDNFTSEPAKYLANICVELDAVYGVGITLTLDWMLDNYFEMEFERRVRPWLTEIYDALKKGNATEKNPVELFKGFAFYVPHKEKMIFVHDWNGSSGNLVIVEKLINLKNYGPGNVYVRRIWNRLSYKYGFRDHLTLAFYRRRNFAPWDLEYKTSGCYGDCRDDGHIFTINFSGGCDNVIWDIGTPMSWFMAINSIWTALVNSEAEHGLSEPESVQRHYDKMK